MNNDIEELKDYCDKIEKKNANLKKSNAELKNELKKYNKAFNKLMKLNTECPYGSVCIKEPGSDCKECIESWCFKDE